MLPELNEPLFHGLWEERALGITVAMGASGAWNIDQSRSMRESLQPAVYYASSYYEIWMSGIEGLIQKTGLVSAEELAVAQALRASKPVARVLSAQEVPAALKKGSPTERQAPDARQVQFKPGDRVRTMNEHPSHHTRLPRYARGKPGKILACHGFHVFADSNAQGLGEQPQPLYTVEFEAQDLWGQNTTASSVCVDCFEPYLRKA